MDGKKHDACSFTHEDEFEVRGSLSSSLDSKLLTTESSTDLEHECMDWKKKEENKCGDDVDCRSVFGHHRSRCRGMTIHFNHCARRVSVY